MSRRRERERELEGGPPNALTLSNREFWISIDIVTGTITSRCHYSVPDKSERNEITGWAINVMKEYGLLPLSPLAVRDAIWGE